MTHRNTGRLPDSPAIKMRRNKGLTVASEPACEERNPQRCRHEIADGEYGEPLHDQIWPNMVTGACALFRVGTTVTELRESLGSE